MKNSHTTFLIILFLTSCVSTNQVFFSDPNYLSSNEFSSAETINEAYSKNQKTQEDSTLTDEENYEYEEYDNDYYYDFSYSSRIRRFHRPMFSYGFYSGYYTDYYWYNPDPFYWGSSIYLGYGWNSPYYGFYSPYYSYYSPFYNNYSYWHNHGYGHHGHNTYHNYDNTYSSFNLNNQTYGPRGSLTTNNRNLIKSNVKSRNTWVPGNNKKFTTNKYTTKNPQINTNKNNKSNNPVKSFFEEKNNRKKTSTKRTYSTKKIYKPKSNYKSNNRSTFKSRSSGSKSSGSRNISRSPKRK